MPALIKLRVDKIIMLDKLNTFFFFYRKTGVLICVSQISHNQTGKTWNIHLKSILVC